MLVSEKMCGVDGEVEVVNAVASPHVGQTEVWERGGSGVGDSVEPGGGVAGVYLLHRSRSVDGYHAHDH